MGISCSGRESHYCRLHLPPAWTGNAEILKDCFIWAPGCLLNLWMTGKCTILEVFWLFWIAPQVLRNLISSIRFGRGSIHVFPPQDLRALYLFVTLKYIDVGVKWFFWRNRKTVLRNLTISPKSVIIQMQLPSASVAQMQLYPHPCSGSRIWTMFPRCKLPVSGWSSLRKLSHMSFYCGLTPSPSNKAWASEASHIEAENLIALEQASVHRGRLLHTTYIAFKTSWLR